MACSSEPPPFDDGPATASTVEAGTTSDGNGGYFCVPDCDGRVCGDNGCGGTCGFCNPHDYCGEVMCFDGLCAELETDDADLDGFYDVCDVCPLDPMDDVDQDGLCADVDNCPEVANLKQLDNDLDAQGDACDPDDDNDAIEDLIDNCPWHPNSLQVDTDLDGAGNVCDDDDDGDHVLDDVDNCPLVINPDQMDLDTDGHGDICDPDGIELFETIYGQSVKRSQSWYVEEGEIFKGWNPVVLRGVNWFGLETHDRAPHGLWVGKTITQYLQQMKDMGFNAIRLPISPGTLDGTPAASWALAQGLETGPMALKAVLDAAEALDVIVLLDHHTCDPQIGGGEAPAPDSCQDYSITDWLDDLVVLAEIAAQHPNVCGIDLFNEPHGMTWSDWAALVDTAAEAVLTVNPHILVFVQGVANASSNGGYAAFWGENLADALNDPLSVPPSRVVYSPHVYGPGVAPQGYFSQPEFPANMPQVWEAHFGALMSTGHVVVPGEFGSKYDEALAPGSTTWMDAWIDFMVQRGLTSFFYWSFNPNSGDTGGLLLDDWVTEETAKLDALAPLLGDNHVPADD